MSAPRATHRGCRGRVVVGISFLARALRRRRRAVVARQIHQRREEGVVRRSDRSVCARGVVRSARRARNPRAGARVGAAAAAAAEDDAPETSAPARAARCPRSAASCVHSLSRRDAVSAGGIKAQALRGGGESSRAPCDERNGRRVRRLPRALLPQRRLQRSHLLARRRHLQGLRQRCRARSRPRPRIALATRALALSCRFCSFASSLSCRCRSISPRRAPNRRRSAKMMARARLCTGRVAGEPRPRCHPLPLSSSVNACLRSISSTQWRARTWPTRLAATGSAPWCLRSSSSSSSSSSSARAAPSQRPGACGWWRHAGAARRSALLCGGQTLATRCAAQPLPRRAPPHGPRDRRRRAQLTRGPLFRLKYTLYTTAVFCCWLMCAFLAASPRGRAAPDAPARAGGASCTWRK